MWKKPVPFNHIYARKRWNIDSLFNNDITTTNIIKHIQDLKAAATKTNSVFKKIFQYSYFKMIHYLNVCMQTTSVLLFQTLPQKWGAGCDSYCCILDIYVTT